jgi:hypothetical protein
MSKFKVQIKSKLQMSKIFRFVLRHSFDICLPALPTAGRRRQGFLNLEFFYALPYVLCSY